MDSFPTPYPIFFFDGEQEQDKGFVDIHSVLTFKRFQSLISQKIGFPPSQLSAFFICRRMLKDSGKWQRLPITVNTNFNVFLNHHNPNKDRDCYFLVSFKKPKRDRRGSRKWGPERDIRDDIMSGGRTQANTVDDTMSQVSANISSLIKSNNKLAKQFADGLFGNNITDNKVILKRSGIHPFHRQNFNNHIEDLQTGTKIFDQDIRHQNRFAFQQKDCKDLLCEQEDSFSRINEWGLQSYSYPHVLHPRTDFDCNHYGQMGFDNLFLEEQFGQGLYRTRRMTESLDDDMYASGLVDSLENSLYRNNLSYVSPNGGFFDHRFLKPKPPSFPIGETDGQQIHGHSFDIPAQLRHFSEGNWQNVPAVNTKGTYPHSQGRLSSSEFKRAEEDTNKTLQCHLCFDYKRKDVSPIPFHCCVEDTITMGFRGPSPAGPIGRRPKVNHGEAAA